MNQLCNLRRGGHKMAVRTTEKDGVAHAHQHVPEPDTKAIGLAAGNKLHHHDGARIPLASKLHSEPESGTRMKLCPPHLLRCNGWCSAWCSGRREVGDRGEGWEASCAP